MIAEGPLLEALEAVHSGRLRPMEAYRQIRAAETTARTAEQVAQKFHEAYERLAPSYGYETRRESAVAWGDVPWANQALMVAVAGEVLSSLEVPS